MLRLWNLALVIMTFSLTLFGTFLTRSGVIASVHAFTQGSIGVFFLSFLALVLLLALGLLAWRWDALKGQGELDSVVSRESAFLLNNVMLVAAAFTVFFGTVFPLLSEAVRGVKVSVGAPFFNSVNIPLFLGLIFLMGVGPLIAWRRASLDNLRRNFVGPIVVGVVGAAVFYALGVRSALAVLSLALTVFVAATIGVDFWIGLKEDLYLVLGDFTRDGRQATVKIQVNRLVTVIWIGGLILTLGTVLSVMPERWKAA